MRVKIFFLIFMVMFGVIYCQPGFHMRYGTNYYDRARAVVQTNDGNFVVAGKTDGFGSGGNGFLMKVNSTGTILWVKDYIGINDDEVYDIIELSNGHLVFSGSTYSFGSGFYDGFVSEVDATGNLIWTKAYGDFGPEVFLKITTDNSRGFYVAGYAGSIAPGSTITRLDSVGNVKWSRFVPVWDPVGDWEPSTFAALKDGGVVFCAGFSGGLTLSSWKFSSTGNLIWSKNFEDGGSGSASGMVGISLVENSSKQLLILGAYSNVATVAQSLDCFVLHTDSMGVPIWYKSYGGIFDDNMRKIIVTKDNGFLISGYTNTTGNGAYDAFLIKAKNNGSLDWAKTYGTIWDEKLSSVQQINDKGFVLCGQTWTSGYLQDSSKIHLVRTDSLGKTSCNYVNWIPTVKNQTVVVNPGSTPQTYSFQTNDVTWSVNNRNLYTKNICSLAGIESFGLNNETINIYPNPNNGSFNLKIDNEIDNGKLILINSIGQKVFEQNIMKGENSISTKGIANGLYNCILLNDEVQISNTKIVIE